MHIPEHGHVVDNTLSAKKLPANTALYCIKSAYRQFKAYPFLWIVIMLLYVAILFIGQQHFLLYLFSFVILIAWQGGNFVIANTIDQGKQPELMQLLQLSQSIIIKLILAQVIWYIMWVFILMAWIAFTVGNHATLLESFDTQDISTNLITLYNTLGTFTFFTSMFVFLFFSTAYAWIPGLIIVNKISPFSAIRLALSACLRNWQMVLLYLLILCGLGFLASIPLFLGWFILLPIINITHFYLWKTTFSSSLNITD